MPDILRDTFKKNVRVSARKGAGLWFVWDHPSGMEIFPQKQGINLCGIPADDDILIVVGKDARLDEITLPEQPRNLRGLAHVIERVGFRLCRVFAEDPGNLRARDIGALG